MPKHNRARGESSKKHSKEQEEEIEEEEQEDSEPEGKNLLTQVFVFL